MYTVIYAHPSPNSYNGAVYNAVCRELEAKNSQSTCIDLYGENFSPAMTRKEHAAISTNSPRNETE